MAFTKSRFMQLSAGDASANDGSVKRLWGYTSDPDSIAEVQTTGYFNEVASLVRAGDMIRVAPNLLTGDDVVEFVVFQLTNNDTVVDIRSPGVLEDDTATPAAAEFISLRFDTGTPPAALNFKGDMRVVDAWIIVDTLPAGANVLTLNITGSPLLTFSYTAASLDKKVPMLANDIDASLANVTSVDTVSWVASSPANAGEGTIYLMVARTQ